ncbi:MAG: outer membrane beta-barrel protein [Ferruginibacter sp.]
MKKLLTIFTLFLFATTIYAQMPQGMPAGTRNAPPSIGHIYGKILDADGKPISNASLMVMQKKFDTISKKTKEVLVKGLITKANGDFDFDQLPLIGLQLKVSASGFAPSSIPVSFLPSGAGAATPKQGAGNPMMGGGAMPSFDKDLGNIKLAIDAKQLQSVTVTATTSSVKLSGDKKIFNVEKNIMSAGGTGLDVMRNVPSVNVDIDGNVTMRNSAPQLLVDGRPTTLTLDQIPADVIESVEVITNPSAKYDASGGGAGILNIVLKKNKKSGYNGNLRAGIDKRGSINSGLDFNVRQGKFNLSASVNVNQNKSRTSGTTDRLNLLDTPQTSIFQNNFNKTTGAFIFGKVGVDYFVTNRSTISLSAIKVHGAFNPNETIKITTDSLYTNAKVSNASERLTTGQREFNGQGLVFGFKHLFPKDGEELTIDANYFGGKNNNNSFYTTNYFANTSGVIVNSDLEKTDGFGSDKNFVIQSDYVLPLSKISKIEAGIRTAIRSRVNNNSNYIYDDNLQDYVVIPSAVSNYKNTDNVYAGYATYSSNIKDFSYKLGLRAESSSYNGELLNTGEKFSNKYAISLFPSVFLSQKLTAKQDIQVSYTRRINRPNFFQLIPFTDYTDKLNITRGNPDLKPEFTQALEMSYLKTFKGNNTFLGSIYYKYTTNLITRYLAQEVNAVTGDMDLLNTYINANSSYAAGVEATSQNYITKAWDISTNINVYNSKVNTSNIENSNAQNALWSWFGKFNSNFKLPSNFAIQFTTTYQSKTNLPVNTGGGGMGGPPMMQSQSASQGYINSSWGMDLAVKKSFLKNNAASVTLSINDIFKTRKQSQYSSSQYFTQEYTRLRDPQMVRLNLSYRFGKIDASLFKRKSMKGEQNAAESIQN